MPVNILYRANASAAKPQSTSVNVGPLTNEQIDGNNRSIKDAIDSIEDNYLPLSGGTLTGALTLKADASADMQPVTYRQLQSIAAGLDVKASVKAATTANITLSGTQTIDGIAVAVDDRVLIKNQSSGNIKNNGIYVVKTGAWTRATDMDSWAKLPGAFVFVEQGNVNADTGWVCTVNAGGTLNTTDITWTQFSGAGTFTAGAGISITGNQISASIATSTTLGSVKVGNGLSIDAGGVLSLGSIVTFVDQYLTPTANNTTSFQPIGGYEVGKIELYVNGILQYSGIDYTASNGTNVALVAEKAVSTVDKLLIRKWKSPSSSLFVEQTFTPQTPTYQFTVTGDYTPGAVTIYLNGVMLFGDGDGYVANTGRTITTTIPVTAGDTLLVRKWITDFAHPFNEVVAIPSSANSTSVTVAGGYIPGTIEVYSNGILLYGDGDNYVANDGVSISSLSPIVDPTDRLLIRRWSLWAI